MDLDSWAVTASKDTHANTAPTWRGYGTGDPAAQSSGDEADHREVTVVIEADAGPRHYDLAVGLKSQPKT
jgi:hypothetical protein